jgi:demethoxyubiquinone hydroxylase (CLK1/Coq7/Cat5 family)
MNQATKLSRLALRKALLSQNSSTNASIPRFSYKDLSKESQQAIDRIIRVDHAGKYQQKKQLTV